MEFKLTMGMNNAPFIMRRQPRRGGRGRERREKERRKRRQKGKRRRRRKRRERGEKEERAVTVWMARVADPAARAATLLLFITAVPCCCWRNRV